MKRGNSAGVSGFQSGPSSSKRSRQSETFEEAEPDIEDLVDSQIVHQNQPILMEVYDDPDTQNQKVIIVASLTGGASDVEFSLVGNGPGTATARITYGWPKFAFEIEELLENNMKKEKLPTCHPKILALKKGLQNTRDSIDEVPRDLIELNLPISVQTAANSISRTGKMKADGSLVLVVELRPTNLPHAVKIADKKVVF